MPVVTRAGAPRANFLVIGAAKAGTTALYDYLDQHPDVFLPRAKEPHTLGFHPDLPLITLPDGRTSPVSPPLVSGVGEYLGLYESANAPLRGDCSASTLYLWRRAIPNIQRFCEAEPRLIAMLRNPVDRAYSSFNHARRRGLEPSEDFRAALAREPATIARNGPLLMRYRDISSYYEQVAAFRAAFGADALLVLLHEDFVADRDRVLKSALAHIGADVAYAFKNVGESNASFVPDSASRVKRAAQRGTDALRPALRQLPRALRRKLSHSVRERTMSRPRPLDATLRAELTDYFRPDIEQLAELIDRDLTHWL
jgi:hypothetical protein